MVNLGLSRKKATPSAKNAGVLGVVEKPNFETLKVSSRIRGSHLIRCVIGTTLSLVHNALQCATEPPTRSQLQGRPSW